MTNTTLWAAVEKTDPKYTKQFSRGGGFKGTATNATYLAKKATEHFGPCGTGWGINVLNEELIQGAPLLLDGQVVAHEMIHKVHARFWYVLDGTRGEVEQFGQTQMVGKNKNGFYTDEEAPKKSLTDAMSKCLSLLGFSADIHLGLYDDNKYVAQLKEEFAPKVPDSPEREAAIKEASDIASLGVARFRQHWASLSKAQRLLISDKLPEFQQVAEAADSKAEAA